jgi:D-alanine-D-alanine ligase-like ATP-grasp enzyme
MGLVGNVWIREHLFEKAGDVHAGHKHRFDHLTILTRGSVEVTTESATKTFTAPTFIAIKADQWHSFKALEDNTAFYCVFALRDVNGKQTDVYDGQHSPYDHAPMTEEQTQQALAETVQLACAGCPGCK